MVNTKIGLAFIILLVLALFTYAAEAAGAPDLMVRKVIVYPTTANIVYAPADGSFVKVGLTFTVTNFGAAAAQKSGAKVTLILPDGSKQDWGVYGTNALAPRRSYVWPINNPAPSQVVNSTMAGINTLMVCADALNQVQEGLEGNNCARTFFIVKVK